MRQPTDIDRAFDPWRRKLAGERVPIPMSDPEPGFYKMRLTKGGPFVPVAIWIDQSVDPETGELLTDERLCCLVNGQHRDPYRTWTWCASRPISEADYRYRIDYGEWASAHAPADPAANPNAPINLKEMEPLL